MATPDMAHEFAALDRKHQLGTITQPEAERWDELRQLLSTSVMRAQKRSRRASSERWERRK